MAGCKTCGAETVGKSKYCRDHALVARAEKFRIIAESAELQAQKRAETQNLFTLAHETAVKALEGVPNGIPGRGFVLIRPGNCMAAHYANENLRAYKGSEGGVQFTVTAGSGIQQQNAYAQAFAAVLREHGIKASAWAVLR